MMDKFFAIQDEGAISGEVVIVEKRPDGTWRVRNVAPRDVDMKGGPS